MGKIVVSENVSLDAHLNTRWRGSAVTAWDHATLAAAVTAREEVE